MDICVLYMHGHLFIRLKDGSTSVIPDPLLSVDNDKILIPRKLTQIELDVSGKKLQEVKKTANVIKNSGPQKKVDFLSIREKKANVNDQIRYLNMLKGDDNFNIKPTNIPKNMITKKSSSVNEVD